MTNLISKLYQDCYSVNVIQQNIAFVNEVIVSYVSKKHHLTGIYISVQLLMWLEQRQGI
jgi:hypothetical protein